MKPGIEHAASRAFFLLAKHKAAPRETTINCYGLGATTAKAAVQLTQDFTSHHGLMQYALTVALAVSPCAHSPTPLPQFITSDSFCNFSFTAFGSRSLNTNF